MKSILSPSEQTMVTNAMRNELTASLSYRQFAAAMKRSGYFGAAAFFNKESQDEMSHYVKWEDFANDCGYLALVPTVDEEFDKPAGLREAVQAAYNMERDLLSFYCDQYELADNHVLCPVLLEFIDVQRKAVGEYGDLLSTLERAKDNIAAILMIDQQMKESVG